MDKPLPPSPELDLGPLHVSAEALVSLLSIDGLSASGDSFRLAENPSGDSLPDISIDVPSSSTGATPTAPVSQIEVEVPELRDLTEDYRLGRLLGHGGQGEVREARQLHLSREIAIKVAHGSFTSQFSFLREAFTTAQLEHPNILPIHELGEMRQGPGRTLAIAMKRIQGTSWRKLLVKDWREARLTRDEFLDKHLRILLKVCSALAYAHSKGVIHRDLKPGQVMVGEFDEVYLLDWGLAVFLEEGRRSLLDREFDVNNVYTLDSAVNPAGTPAYMAPEQTDASTERLGIHTDIYLLGAILYELLAGHPPHLASTLKAAVEHSRRNELAPLPPDTPEDLRGLASLCLETDPLDRPRSALDVRDTIEAHLSGATRRKHSREATRRFLGRPAPTEPKAIADQARQLAQAAHDWPANPELAEASERLRECIARAALAEGDLLLARSQVDRLGESPEATKLRHDLGEEQERVARALSPAPLVRPATLAGWAALCVALVAAMGTLLLVVRGGILREVDARVESLAMMAADAVRAEDLLAVATQRDPFSAEFQRTLARLDSIRANNPDVRYVYTLAPLQPPRSWTVLVDIDPLNVDANANGVIDPDEAGNPPGGLYDEGIPEMGEVLESHEPRSAFLTDSWGSFLSGFAPIVDPATGDVIAITGVDLNLEMATRRLRQVTLLGVLSGLAALLMASATYWALLSSRRALDQAHALEEHLRRQTKGSRIRSLLPG